MSAEPRGFVYEPARGPKRKIEFRETDNGFVRVESVWTGCRWRPTGQEACLSMRRV